MHNVLSRSQLDEWRHFEDPIDSFGQENQNLNDYYECLIESELQNQHESKKICKHILT